MQSSPSQAMNRSVGLLPPSAFFAVGRREEEFRHRALHEAPCPHAACNRVCPPEMDAGFGAASVETQCTPARGPPLAQSEVL